MGKLRVLLCMFFLLTFCFSSGFAVAGNIDLYDRDPANSGTTVAYFYAYFSDTGNNGVYDTSSTIKDGESFSGVYTRGYPYDYSYITPSPNTWARSSVDFTSGAISSQIQYSFAEKYNWYITNVARVDIYSKTLPGSYSLAGTAGDAFNSRFVIQVFDQSGTALGFIILSNSSGNYQMVVSSLNDNFLGDYNWGNWLPSNAALPGHADLASYVAWIVGGRSTDFYYQIGAEVSTNDRDGGSYSATLNFGNAAPVPEPGTMLLLGLGLAGVAVARRRFRK